MEENKLSWKYVLQSLAKQGFRSIDRQRLCNGERSAIRPGICAVSSHRNLKVMSAPVFPSQTASIRIPSPSFLYFIRDFANEKLPWNPTTISSKDIFSPPITTSSHCFNSAFKIGLTRCSPSFLNSPSEGIGATGL